MSATLYPYYEEQLHFLRRDAGEFAKQYPAAAGQLLLDDQGSRDPHVERLIEAFALLSARVEKKLDDEFPEITDGLLGTLYPHYLAPIPSLGTACFQADPASPQPAGVRLPRGSVVRTEPVDGVACRYRTCYETTLWPLEVTHASVGFPPLADHLAPPPGAGAVVRIGLRTHGELPLGELSLDTLRLCLDGDSALMAELYECLFNRALRVEAWTAGGGRPHKLSESPASALRQVGFAADEGLLPYPSQSSAAYRLLTELFAFPQKFAFVDITGLRAALRDAAHEAELVVYLSHADERLTHEVSRDTFRLGCTPVVNLQEKVCEPIRVDHTRTEYPVIPEAQRRGAFEVYSVDRVTGVDPRSQTEYRPLYGLDHENSWEGPEQATAYWHTRRRPAARHDDAATDVSLRLTDLGFDPAAPGDRSVTVRATCTNRDLPTRLPAGPAGLRLRSESSQPVRSVAFLRPPSAPIRPPLGKRAYWRLVSHLSLNHLSLVDQQSGADALRAMLRLYDFSDRTADRARAIAASEMIDGVLGVSSRATACRIGTARDGGFCRGVAVDVDVDEDNYRGVGALLFGSVMERFFAEYATVNSFTKLTLRSKQRGEIKSWPPRSGDTPLV
ncbi:type VI secretion system baseplate subunit TssF [Botrimarina sp.]|uniref:type VI secretion system baseplate subunit TssF n=1 Tax=Botrimarina sp. TaxID=2795802 RepID=UPI0032EB04DC